MDIARKQRSGRLHVANRLNRFAVSNRIPFAYDPERVIDPHIRNNTPGTDREANRNEILTLGPANTTVPIFENRMDAKSVFLTANTETHIAGCRSICGAVRW